MRVTVLASGSRGNAALFDDGRTRVLVDAGIPLAALRQRLAKTRSPAPDALVITHAHGDHHRFAGEVALHFKIPVWTSESTRRVLPLHGAPSVRVFGASEAFRIGTLTVSPLPLPHDAPQVSLRVAGHDGRAAAIATDLGEVPPGLEQHLKGCVTVLIESNHDVEMLWRGPYSNSLKRRVASPRGHLSNRQCGELLARLDRRVETVVLAHLSETNNRPDIALSLAAEALADHTARLLAASQDAPAVIEATPARQLELF